MQIKVHMSENKYKVKHQEAFTKTQNITYTHTYVCIYLYIYIYSFTCFVMLGYFCGTEDVTKFLVCRPVARISQLAPSYIRVARSVYKSGDAQAGYARRGACAPPYDYYQQ